MTGLLGAEFTHEVVGWVNHLAQQFNEPGINFQGGASNQG
jgi:hypothetical protein